MRPAVAGCTSTREGTMSATALLRSAPATTSARARIGASSRLGVGSARGLEVPTSSFRRRGRASALSVFAGKKSRAGKKSGGGGGSGKSSSSGGGAPKRQAAPGNPAPRITGKVGRMTVHTQIKLVERYKSLTSGGSGGGSGPGGGKGGAAAKPATVEKTGFRRVKDDAYQEELARAPRGEAGGGAPPAKSQSLRRQRQTPRPHRRRIQHLRLRRGRRRGTPTQGCLPLRRSGDGPTTPRRRARQPRRAQGLPRPRRV